MDDLISVIVPVYNTAEYLDACIESIVFQTYKNLEIILIDDGSTDLSGEKCDEWKGRDKRIVVVHQRNKGLSEARNTGIDKCNGRWLTFIDSDDVISSEYVRHLYEIAKEYNVMTVQCERGDLQKGSGDLIDIAVKKMRSNEFLLSRQYQTTAWGKLYNRELFEKIRYPVGKIHEDLAITYKVIYAAKNIVYTNEILYFVREREGSITRRKRFYKERLDVLQFYKEQIEFYEEKREEDLVKKACREYAYALLVNYSKTKNELRDKINAKKIKKEYCRICWRVIKEDNIISKQTRILLAMCSITPGLWMLLERK